MDKKLAGLLGAMGAFAAATPSHAATAHPISTEQAMRAGSYADLLKPIPNATALLQASDAAMADAPAVVTLVQDHHHHRYVRRRRRIVHHHHHHHHSQMSVPNAPKAV